MAIAKTKDAAKSTAKPTSLESLKLVEGDEKGNDVKSLKAEMLVSSTELKALKQLQMLIRKYHGTPLEPELHFRMAELYMRKSKTDRFFEIHRESDTVIHLAPRVTKEASSKDSVQKAVATYTLIQKKFPDFVQMDLVIFNHAFASQILANDKEAESLYLTLVSKYSESPLVPDAHLALGEIAFTRGQFPQALERFNAIKKFPESRVYPYGLYKAAWTYYNMRDAEKALKKLEEVVTYGKFVAQNQIEARLDLRKEALNDMTLFYEDVYPSKDVYKYFREQAGELEVGPIVLRMATLYERHSRFVDQRVVLDEFIQQLPKSPLLPQVHMDLVQAYDHLRQKDQSVVRLEDFAKLCVPGGTWVKAVAKTPEEAKTLADDCLVSLNETSLKMAKKWLKAWKKLPTDTTFAEASEKAFSIFLRTPGTGAEYAQSRFAFAELLFARNKFRQASVEYAAVSRVDGAGALTHDAGYGALISLEKAVGEKWSNEDEKTFHVLAQEYLAKNPNGQYRLDIQYKMALLAYEKNRYDEAAPLFLKLGREYGNQEKGQKSQDLYIDILNIKKDYLGIRNYAQELSKQTPDHARATKMQKLYEQAYFLQIQGMEEKAQFKEALREYLVFCKVNPGSEFVEKAMWNTMLLQYKLGDVLAGARSSEDFATKYSSSPQAVNALLRAAQTFEQMAQLREAARVLEKLAAKDEKGSRRWRELAADFHALENEAGAARKLYNDLKAGAEPAQKTALLNKLESLERNYGTDRTHADLLKTMIDQGVQPYANEAKIKSVEKLFDAGNVTEAFNEARRFLGAGMNNNEKAHLRMVQAKILEQEFLKQSVKSRAERLATVLAIKTEKLEKAQEAFQSTIKYGDPKMSLEAFEHLYGLYAHYVKALKEMPAPPGLTPADEKALRAEIDKLVIPLEEKSVDTLAQAVTFARKQLFLDGTMARLENDLSKLNQQSPIANLLPDLQKPELVVPVLAEVSP
ncbi:MAG: tetratricopeptide repeat protein [Bdellovibrionales bacterium]